MLHGKALTPGRLTSFKELTPHQYTISFGCKQHKNCKVLKLHRKLPTSFQARRRRTLNSRSQHLKLVTCNTGGCTAVVGGRERVPRSRYRWCGASETAACLKLAHLRLVAQVWPNGDARTASWGSGWKYGSCSHLSHTRIRESIVRGICARLVTYSSHVAYHPY